MKTIAVRPNQSMLDVIIQCCGSLEAGWQFCVDNAVSISEYPMVGVVYIVSDEAVAMAGAAGAAVVKYLTQNGVVVGTLNRPVIVEVPLLNDDGTPLLNDDGSGLFADQ